MDQWNRTESSEINYITMVYYSSTQGQEYTTEKKQSLQEVVLGKLAACVSMKLEHTFTLYTKINSKWLKDLNIRHKTPR